MESNTDTYIYSAVNPNQLHMLFFNRGYFILKYYLFHVLFEHLNYIYLLY